MALAAEYIVDATQHEPHGDILKLNESEYLIAYEGDDGDGYLELYTISADGGTITKKWIKKFELTLRIGIEPMTSRLTVARSNQLS